MINENNHEKNELLLEGIDNNKFNKFNKQKLLSIFIIFLILIIPNNIAPKMTVCLCTLGKNENKYTREFVEFYKNIGVDKIIIYDNNDEDGEKFEYVIPDYINSSFVEIIDYRGQDSIQLPSINDCFQKYMKIYNWIMINDMDEFIHLKENNIKKFLSLDRLKNCNVIHFNWRHHSDSGQIYYKNESLFKRFPDIVTRVPETVKSIIRGKRKPIYTNNHHVLKYNYSCCNAFGIKIMENEFINEIQIRNPDYKDYFFDHFYTKSAEEYIEKKIEEIVFLVKIKELTCMQLMCIFVLIN